MYTPYDLPVNLLDPAMYILGPFNFQVPSIPTQVPVLAPGQVAILSLRSSGVNSLICPPISVSPHPPSLLLALPLLFLLPSFL